MLLGSNGPCSDISTPGWMLFALGCLLEGGQGFVPESVEPIAQSFDALRIDGVEAARAIDADHHQAGGFQHFQVLGDSRTAHVHAFGYLAHRTVSLAQAPENSPPGWISQRIERPLNS